MKSVNLGVVGNYAPLYIINFHNTNHSCKIFGIEYIILQLFQPNQLLQDFHESS